MILKDLYRSFKDQKMTFKEYFLDFTRQKANHLLNRSTIQNLLSQELSRNKEFLRSFL